MSDEPKVKDQNEQVAISCNSEDTVRRERALAKARARLQYTDRFLEIEDLTK